MVYDANSLFVICHSSFVIGFSFLVIGHLALVIARILFLLIFFFALKVRIHKRTHAFELLVIKKLWPAVAGFGE